LAWAVVSINELCAIWTAFLAIINTLSRFMTWNSRRTNYGFTLFGVDGLLRGCLALRRLLRSLFRALLRVLTLFRGSLLMTLLRSLVRLGRSLVRLGYLLRRFLLLTVNLINVRILRQRWKDDHRKESQENDDPQNPH